MAQSHMKQLRLGSALAFNLIPLTLKSNACLHTLLPHPHGNFLLVTKQLHSEWEHHGLAATFLGNLGGNALEPPQGSQELSQEILGAQNSYTSEQVASPLTSLASD